MRQASIKPKSRWPNNGSSAATAALRGFRQAMLRLPQRARRSPIVWGAYERVTAEPDVEQIARRLHYASGEAQQWWSYKTKLQIGAAAFVDTAIARQRLFPDSKTDVDVGIGLRLSAPGFGGVVRIDIAHGLRDGDDALSFVYEP